MRADPVRWRDGSGWTIGLQLSHSSAQVNSLLASATVSSVVSAEDHVKHELAGRCLELSMWLGGAVRSLEKVLKGAQKVLKRWFEAGLLHLGREPVSSLEPRMTVEGSVDASSAAKGLFFFARRLHVLHLLASECHDDGRMA